MGYNITIGNAVLEACDPDDYDGELKGWYFVTWERHDNAPADSAPTAHTNERWPSYSGWSDFCEETGLSDLFFSKYDGLMRKHPGCFKLEQRHLDIIKSVAGHVPEKQRGRYEWLGYWVEWALNNCELPAIENS